MSEVTPETTETKKPRWFAVTGVEYEATTKKELREKLGNRNIHEMPRIICGKETKPSEETRVVF